MRRSEFVIGKNFWCGGKEWRCTDIGTRTIVAICLDGGEAVEYSPGPPKTKKIRHLSRSQSKAEGWHHGPPYAVAESVFGEYDMPGCSASREEVELRN
jgi:hypothetical protein